MKLVFGKTTPLCIKPVKGPLVAVTIEMEWIHSLEMNRFFMQKGMNSGEENYQ